MARRINPLKADLPLNGPTRKLKTRKLNARKPKTQPSIVRALSGKSFVAGRASEPSFVNANPARSAVPFNQPKRKRKATRRVNPPKANLVR